MTRFPRRLKNYRKTIYCLSIVRKGVPAKTEQWLAILRIEAGPVGATLASPVLCACVAHEATMQPEKGEDENENGLVVGRIVCRGGDGS